MGDFIVGCDLGKVNDFTAVPIIERMPPPMKHVRPDPYSSRIEQVPAGPRPLHLRHLERLPKGTRYPKVVELVGQRKQSVTSLNSKPTLVVDHTGVGVAVVDLFEDAGLEPIAITITGGDAVNQEGMHFRVPKRELVTTTQVAMQTGRLKFAATLPDLPMLEGELAAFNYKITPGGHDTYEAWRERDHDDLVLAVALAVWYAEWLDQFPPWTKEDLMALSRDRAGWVL
jgi:hypothetical protein